MPGLICTACGSALGPSDEAAIRCGQCGAHVSRFVAEFAGFAKDLVQHGTLHDCSEWPTTDGTCAMCGRPVNLH